MQTFVPYPDLRLSCQVLDDRRLGKQRVETYQILRALTWPEYAWKNHPAVRMWRGFVPALVGYGLESCREWTRRGYADSVAAQLLAWTGGEVPQDAPLPPWFGLEPLHLSHRSALLRKDPAHYRPLFGPDEPADLPYLWPPDVFPRWPVRGGPAGVPVEQAAVLLGLEAPLPWQADVVAALDEGRDVLLAARPGTGGTTAGLFAALSRPGRTLWVSPWDGPVAGPPPAFDPPVPRTDLPAPDAERPHADRPPPIARSPGPADLAAMTAEQAPPEFVFAHPDSLPVPDDVSLVVVDGAGRLTADELRRIAAARPAAPVLAVVDRADPGRRAELAVGLALRSPVAAGGGWDPAATVLGVRAVTTPQARRRALTELVRGDRPALVVTAGRERAGRLVTGLVADGLRAAAWAPPPLRASRAAAAVAAWRTRRLDALVVPAGELPPLGRVRPALLVGDGRALGGADDWQALVDVVGAARAVLLAGPDATPGAAALAASPGCRRAALLAPFGEPVAVPCGRCDGCGPAA